MALVFRGISKCLLCEQVIATNDDVIAFPAFLPAGHPLSRYSDSALHQGCFAACPDRMEIESLYSRVRRIWEERPKDLKSVEEMDAWAKQAFKDFK